MKWNSIDDSFRWLEYNREKQLLHVYKEELDKVRKTINNVIKRHGVEGKLGTTDLVKYGRMVKLEKDLTKELKGLGSSVHKITREGIKGAYADQFYGVGYVVENGTGVNFGFAQLPTEQVNAALDNPYDWPKRIVNNQNMLKMAVKDGITRNLIQGAGYAGFDKTITKIFNISAGRAKRILRTEMHRAQVEGRLAGIGKTESAADRLGVEYERTWSSFLGDDRTRDSHIAMNGVVADHETKLFTLPSGATCRGPGLSGIAEEDINCRCSVRMRFPGYEPDTAASEGMKPGKGNSCLVKL